MAHALDNENQSSDETYISKEDLGLCDFAFNTLLEQEMQLFQKPVKPILPVGWHEIPLPPTG